MGRDRKGVGERRGGAQEESSDTHAAGRLSCLYW